jgi:NitT/TauT family transport system ATP-binding protein
MSVVQIQDLSYTYPGAEGVEALRDISFEVRENEFVSVIGPSGCGKSTLLRLVADLLPLTSGKVLVDAAPAAIARRRRDIGFVFQEPALMPWRTTSRNVRLPLEIFRRGGNPVGAGQDKRARGSAGSQAVVQGLLGLVGLQDFGGKRPDQLSGGMRQRVSIARALTYEPQLLLMDEPFGALDQITRDEMNQELLKVWEQKQSTVLFVTHSIAEAIYLSDRVVVLTPRPGRIASIVDVPIERPRDPAVKRTPLFFETETQVLGALEGRLTRG